MVTFRNTKGSSHGSKQIIPSGLFSRDLPGTENIPGIIPGNSGYSTRKRGGLEMTRLGQSIMHSNKQPSVSVQQPDKRAQMVAWALVHRVPVEAVVGPQDIANACSWFGLTPAEWEELARSAPHLAAEVESKRVRRRAWAIEHGSVPDDWTPPDPTRPKSRQPMVRRKSQATRAEMRAHRQARHEAIRWLWRRYR